jgi:hypothetical protein
MANIFILEDSNIYSQCIIDFHFHFGFAYCLVKTNIITYFQNVKFQNKHFQGFHIVLTISITPHTHTCCMNMYIYIYLPFTFYVLLYVYVYTYKHMDIYLCKLSNVHPIMCIFLSFRIHNFVKLKYNIQD